MNIVNEPNQIENGFNPFYYTVYSANESLYEDHKYIFDVSYYWENDLTTTFFRRYTLPKNAIATGCTFSPYQLRKILKNTFQHSISGATDAKYSHAGYNVAFGEYYSGITYTAITVDSGKSILNSVKQHYESYQLNDYAASAGQTVKFLSTYPVDKIKKKININEKETLSVLVGNYMSFLNYAYIRIDTYANGFKIGEFAIPSSFPSLKRFDIPVGIANFNGEAFFNYVQQIYTKLDWHNFNTPDSYKIWFVSDSTQYPSSGDTNYNYGSMIIGAFDYVLDCHSPNFETFRIEFVDRLGAASYFTFTKASEKEIEIKRQTYEKALYHNYEIGQRGIINHVNTARESVKCHSDLLTEVEKNWLEQIITSTEVNLIKTINGNELKLPIVLIDKKFTIAKDDLTNDLYDCSIEFEYAFDRNLQI